MKTFLLTLLIVFAALPALAAEEDSVPAVFAFGRTGAKLTTGFAVADGSYVVTYLDSVCETVSGKFAPVPYAVVASRWTGDAYFARVVATDGRKRLALLKLTSPAFPGVPVADNKALTGARTTTIGEVLSGEDAGRNFAAEILALKVTHKPEKFTIAGYRSAKACMAELARETWLFLSQVQPPEKIPDSALVLKRGGGAVGLYSRRIVVTGGPKSVTYYRAIPGKAIQEFLVKAGLPSAQVTHPPDAGKQQSDGDAAFQAVCRALSASMTGSASASALADAAVKLRPKSAAVQLLLGSALLRAGKPQGALKAIDAALAIDPAAPDGSLTRGNALAVLGKTEDAEKAFRQAIQDDPNDARPLIAISDMLTSADRRLDEATSLAKDAVKLAPDSLPAHLALARAMKHAKDYDGATAELQSLIKRDPKQPAVHLALGATYEAVGKADLAEAEYRKMFELQPTSAEARLPLIDFLISAGKTDNARQEIEAARKLKPKPAEEESLKKLEAKLTQH